LNYGWVPVPTHALVGGETRGPHCAGGRACRHLCCLLACHLRLRCGDYLHLPSTPLVRLLTPSYAARTLPHPLACVISGGNIIVGLHLPPAFCYRIHIRRYWFLPAASETFPISVALALLYYDIYYNLIRPVDDARVKYQAFDDINCHAVTATAFVPPGPQKAIVVIPALKRPLPHHISDVRAAARRIPCCTFI